MPSESERDSGDVRPLKVEQTKIRIGKLIKIGAKPPEFDPAIDEFTWLIGDDEANEHVIGFLKGKFAQEVPGAKCHSKDWALVRRMRAKGASKASTARSVTTEPGGLLHAFEERHFAAQWRPRPYGS